jgi:hypothetical protein
MMRQTCSSNVAPCDAPGAVKTKVWAPSAASNFGQGQAGKDQSFLEALPWMQEHPSVPGTGVSARRGTSL